MCTSKKNNTSFCNQVVQTQIYSPKWHWSNDWILCRSEHRTSNPIFLIEMGKWRLCKKKKTQRYWYTSLHIFSGCAVIWCYFWCAVSCVSCGWKILPKCSNCCVVALIDIWTFKWLKWPISLHEKKLQCVKCSAGYCVIWLYLSDSSHVTQFLK